MVLQCPACQTRMKVRREVAVSSRLLCPQCHNPVPTAAPEAPAGRSEEFRPSALPQRPAEGQAGSRFALPSKEIPTIQGRNFSQAPRDDTPPGARPAAAHPEFDGRLPEYAPGEEEEEGDEDGPDQDAGMQRLHPEERRRVRIKKRKTKRPNALRYLELADWDHNDLTAIPEAEIAADEWAQPRPIPEDVGPAQDENEYVVESVEGEDGQTKTTKKKVRRRRLLLGARLFFKRFNTLSRNFGIGLAALLAIVAVGYGFYVFRQEYIAPDLPPVPEFEIDRSVLTSYDLQGAEKAVRDFLAADGIEAKLAFVRQPERIRPLMQRWYRDERTAAPLQAGEIAMHDKKGGEYGNTAYYVILAMPVFQPDPLNPGSTYEEQTFFAVEEIRNGPTSTYLVDWETSTGYQELPLETYKATMPPEPYPFRIFMKEDNYYNHGFSALEWQCVELYYPGRQFHLYGYINRDSAEGRKILPLVQDGGRAGIIAELVYPPNPASRDQVIVKRMIHSSWFYNTAAEARQLGDAIEPEKTD